MTATTPESERLTLPDFNDETGTVLVSKLTSATVAFDSDGKQVILLHEQDRTVVAPFSEANLGLLKELGISIHWPFIKPPANDAEAIRQRLERRRSNQASSPLKSKPSSTPGSAE